MSFWLTDYRARQEAAKGRTLQLTIALSLAIHLAALSWIPRMQPGAPTAGDLLPGESDRLRVQLAAIPRFAPEPIPEPPRPIVAMPKPRTSPPPRAAMRSQPAAVLTAPPAAAPAIATPPPAPPVPAPAETRRPAEGDLFAYVQARRRERGESPAPAIDHETEVRNANLAANLPSPATGVASREPNHGGGLFEIKRMDYDDAAFEFFGWNDDMGRKTPQLIEVRLGDNSDMRIAVVRKMISIIREHSTGNFVWKSPHYVDGIWLSARASDNAELENFLLHEFFDDPRRIR
jgi:hypothetical protein